MGNEWTVWSAEAGPPLSNSNANTKAEALPPHSIRTLCVLLLFVFACGRAHEEEATRAEKTETAVTLSAETARANDIVVTTLAPAEQRDAIIGNATVVDVTELVNATSQRAAALAQREQAAARLTASRAELQRLRVLNADDRNVSDRAVQEAAANVAMDEASVRSADNAAASAEAAARQRWGVALTHARALAARDEALLEVVFTANGVPPARIRVAGAAGAPVVARYLAPAPRVDARLQKPLHQYVAPARDLPTGFVTTIHAGLQPQGVFIPRGAVVWYGDKALVFVEEAPGHYAPRAIDATVAADGGFIVDALKPGQRIVTSGAQQLLSEQHKPEVE